MPRGSGGILRHGGLHKLSAQIHLAIACQGYARLSSTFTPSWCTPAWYTWLYSEVIATWGIWWPSQASICSWASLSPSLQSSDASDLSLLTFGPAMKGSGQPHSPERFPSRASWSFRLPAKRLILSALVIKVDSAKRVGYNQPYKEDIQLSDLRNVQHTDKLCPLLQSQEYK